MMSSVFRILVVMLAGHLVCGARKIIGSRKTTSNSADAYSSKSSCRNYCLRCKDGSTVWMHRWKKPINWAKAPVVIPLKLLPYIGRMTPDMNVAQCRKMSLSKFQRNPSAEGTDTCSKARLARAGWMLRKQYTNELKAVAHSFHKWDEAGSTCNKQGDLVSEGVQEQDAELKPFDLAVNDHVAYDVGCAALMYGSAGEGPTTPIANAAWLCASLSSLCGMGGVKDFLEAEDSEQCQAACEGDSESRRIYSDKWNEAIKAKLEQNFLTDKSLVKVVLGIGDPVPFSFAPAVHNNGAIVAKYNNDSWEAKGVVNGSVLMTLNGKRVLDTEFAEVKKILSTNQTSWLGYQKPVTMEFALPRACSSAVMAELQSRYVIVKDKHNRHMYVGCQDNEQTTQRKISCHPVECGGNSWCFIPKGCGGMLGKACEQSGNPLECPPKKQNPNINPPAQDHKNEDEGANIVIQDQDFLEDGDLPPPT